MSRVLAKTFFRLMLKLPKVKKIISEIQRNKLLEFPPVVQVETTNLCNAECIMCPHSKLTRPVGHMGYGLYKEIVDNCAEYQDQVKYFYPFLNGDLFLAPQWNDYLAYAREKLPHTKIGIFTNGSLLNTKNIYTLLEIQPDLVRISFDGTSKESYEKIRKKLNFEQVENNIIELVNYRKKLRKKKPRITVSIIKMGETSYGLESFYKKWVSLVDSVNIDRYSNWGGAVEDKNPRNRILDRRSPCPRLWHNFTILNTGDVVICCLDYNGEIVIGDIKKQSIKEIWTDKKITELRNFNLEGEYSKIYLCKDCSYGKYQRDAPIWWY